MKVHEAVNRRRNATPPLRERVLRYLNEHSDEVFTYRDEQLTERLGAKASALSFTLWTLHKDGLIDREEIDGKVYFGSKAAIIELRQRTGKVEEDPWERVRMLRDRIWKRTGNIDVIELLDAVRGPWD
jgi:hypothetical protein